MSIPPMLSAERKGLFLKLIVIGFAQAALTILTALLIRFVFDRWITGTPADFGVVAIVTVSVLMLTACFNALMRFAERVNAERLGQHYICEVRLALYDQLVSIAPWTLQKRSRGGHLLRFVGDLTALRQWLSQGLATLIVAFITTFFSIIALFFINVILASTVAAILFLGAVIALRSGQHMHEQVKESRHRRAMIAANVNEKIASLPVVQIFNQIKRERKVLSRQSRKLKQSMINRAKVMGRLRGITEATNGFATLCVLFVGAYEVSQGQTTAGMVVASMSILSMLLPSFRNLGRIYEYWHSYRVSIERISMFMETPDLIVDQPKTKRLKVAEGKIKFQNITLSHIFDDLNGEIPGKTRLAIIGPNGAGKSTLIDMIGRLVDPDSGKICIDNQNIKHCSLTSIRRVIGIVSPDLPLLRGTIERNLRYRHRNATEQELKQVCKLCGVDTLISELPDGINTRVVDGGINLSLGQRQRISLARALLGNPKILLLDEADANLDQTSKKLFNQILASYTGTVIIITHNYEQAANADYIWYVSHGRIIESGSPEKLFSQQGSTAAFFKFNLKVVDMKKSSPLLKPAKKIKQVNAQPIEKLSRRHWQANTIKTCVSKNIPEFVYHIYAPSYGAEGLPVLVAVHGISHQAKEQSRAFSLYAEQHGFVLIAPLFNRKNFPAFQRLGISQQNVPCYPDIALNSLLDEIGEQAGALTDKVYLFGYSAGGQFVHRYAMAYPEKVHAIALGAAGWYTFPDMQTAFPRGLQRHSRLPSIELKPERFLKVPMATFVGEHDIQQDNTFRRSSRLDSQQGITRIERAERWIQAMQKEAQIYGFDTCYQSHVLQFCGHSFADCVQHGQLTSRVINFLFETSNCKTKEKQILINSRIQA